MNFSLEKFIRSISDYAADETIKSENRWEYLRACWMYLTSRCWDNRDHWVSQSISCNYIKSMRIHANGSYTAVKRPILCSLLWSFYLLARQHKAQCRNKSTFRKTIPPFGNRKMYTEFAWGSYNSIQKWWKLVYLSFHEFTKYWLRLTVTGRLRFLCIIIMWIMELPKFLEAHHSKL